MKTQIRRCIFETNSSSVHSVVILNHDEWLKWKTGETIVSRHGKFVPINEIEADDYEYDQDYIDIEEAEKEIGDEKIHAISIYAEDY